jgi:hypothetical protein
MAKAPKPKRSHSSKSTGKAAAMGLDKATYTPTSAMLRAKQAWAVIFFMDGFSFVGTVGLAMMPHIQARSGCVRLGALFLHGDLFISQCENLNVAPHKNFSI